MLCALDEIIVIPPQFEIVKDENNLPVGEPVGVPIYLLLDIPSNTAAACDLFRLPAFNKAMRALLDYWGEYLSDPKRDSNSSLHTGEKGWFSKAGMAKLSENGRIPEGPDGFIRTYVTRNDKPEEGFGYTTWDEGVPTRRSSYRYSRRQS